MGPPGVGKSTRARTWLSGRPDAVVVELARVAERADVLERIAAGLGRPLSNLTPEAALAVLGRGLGERVLLLDDADHALDALAQVVPALLAQGARHIVCTSCEPIRVRDEQVVEAHPLALDEAVELLSVRSGRPADADLEALATLLDRLPLALELAAPLVRLLPARALLERLQRGIDLVSTSRDVDPRHRSLDVAFSDAWERLEEGERAALHALSVFQGAFSLEAAEHVLDDAGGLALAWLARLREVSMLATVGQADEIGFTLLHQTRAFVQRRCGAPPPEVSDRLRAWLREAAEDADEAWLRAEPSADRFFQRHVPDLLALLDEQPDAELLEPFRKALLSSMFRPRWTALFDRITRQDPRVTHASLMLRISLAGGVMNLEGPKAAALLVDAVLEDARSHGLIEAEGVALSLRSDVWFRRSEQDKARADIEAALERIRSPLARAIALGRRALFGVRSEGGGTLAQESAEALYRRHRMNRMLSALLAHRALTASDARRSREHLDEALEVAEKHQGPTGWLTTQAHGYGVLAGALYVEPERALAHGAAFRACAVGGSFERCVLAVEAAARILQASQEGRRVPVDVRDEAERLAREAPGPYAGFTLAALALDAALDGDADAATRWARLRTERAGPGVGQAILALLSDEAPLPDDSVFAAVVRAFRQGQALPPWAAPAHERFDEFVLHGVVGALRKVRIHREGRFVATGSQRWDLSRRRVPRRLLRAVVEASEPLSAAELIRAGWPGERMRERSALNRLYTQIRELRHLGLADVLLHDGDGYRLDTRRVVIVDGPSGQSEG